MLMINGRIFQGVNLFMPQENINFRTGWERTHFCLEESFNLQTSPGSCITSYE